MAAPAAPEQPKVTPEETQQPKVAAPETPPGSPSPPRGGGEGAVSSPPQPTVAGGTPAPAKPQRPAPAAERRVPPEVRKVRGLLAEAHRARDRGRADAALDLYGKALHLEPANADALAGQGLCYLDLSQYAPAEKSFQAALQADPSHGAALMGLAETYRYEGRNADAVTYYRKYLAAHPGGEDAAAARNAMQALEESQ